VKLKVKVDDRYYDVEIDDLKSRPILVSVDGEAFEVWPESKTAYSTVQIQRSIKEKEEKPSLPSLSPDQKIKILDEESRSDSTSPEPVNLKAVRAPIPGVITAISVQPGTEVAVGQELCKLEAMKMNNSIRASKAGRIASVNISIGQTVKHNELLMEYA
jgi:glutaconyl-CoA/methylmalonyl-CoA decarboxylase subunit gamma